FPSEVTTMSPPPVLEIAPPRYDVAYVAQLRTHSCWYACAQMLWKYRHPDSETSAQPDFTKRPRSGSEFGRLLEKSPPLGDGAESGTGTTEKDWPVLHDLGF